jgi:hypothetical protein
LADIPRKLASHEFGRSQVKECAEMDDESRQTVAMVFSSGLALPLMRCLSYSANRQ